MTRRSLQRTPTLRRPQSPLTTQGIYVPAGWGDIWRPKRDACLAGGKATVAVFGDSIGHYYNSNLDTKTYPGRIAAALQPTYGDGGTGFFGVGHSTVHLNSLNTANSLWGSSLFVQLTGTWASSNVNDGPGQRGIQSVTDGSTATRVVRGTRAGIYYLQQGTGGGTFTVAIDGGTAVTINTTAGAAGIGKYEVTGLSSGTHTVVVTKTGTTRADFCGFFGENDTGVLVNNFSAYGATSGNDSSGGTFGFQNTWSGGYKYPCDLYIYAKGANDTNAAATAPDTFIDNVRKTLDQVRSAGTATGATEIILFLPAFGGFDTTRFASQYAARLRGLADHFGAALVNANPVFRNNGTYAQSKSLNGVANGASPGAVGSDSVHLSDIGAQLYADLLMQVIGS